MDRTPRSPEPSDQGMNEGTLTRVLGLVGLGMRARNVVVGVERVRDAARRGKLRFAIVASDGAANSRAKVIPLLQARRVMFVEGPGVEALGAAIGKGPTVVVGVTDPALAAGIRKLVGRGSAERERRTGGIR